MKEEQKIQLKPLSIAVIISLAFGAYFLRGFFSVIAFAAISAYLFFPLFQRIEKRIKRRGAAASLTFVVLALVILLPLTLVAALTVIQVNSLLQSVGDISSARLGELGQETLNFINNLLAQFPGDHKITEEDLTAFFKDSIAKIGNWTIDLLVSSVSSIPRLITNFILYIYIFVNLLLHKDEIIRWMKNLNPLGSKTTSMYLEKVGDMTTAMVKGQFVVAIVQGLIGAASVYLAGFHNIFFFMFLILTAFSLIPLGGGIILIPFGIVLLFMGDIVPALIILLTHFLLTTNIDQVIRPRLVPDSAKLNSALLLLGVFSGLAMFGFLGIVIGPVIMILITTTVRMYLDAQAAKG